MNAALKERLERIARDRHEDDVLEGRHITFDVCRLCGLAKWRCSSAPGLGFGVAVSDIPLECERCHDVSQRAPEIVRWVIGVLSYQQMMDQK